MLGRAAYGKTTYCLWLLRKWCNAKRKEGKEHKEFDKWENELKKFDFVFLMRFRNVNDLNLVSVVEMICQDAFENDKVFHDDIRNVLSSDKYRSLVIMDGLDELNSNSNNRMPKIDVSGSVTCFISMRPWVFPLLLKKPQHSNRVIEIRGLSETGLDNVIRNVLVNHYKMKEKSPKFKIKHDKVLEWLQNENVKSFMQIPLLAVICVQILYNGKQAGDSMTSFYAEMLNMLIERKNEKHGIRIELRKTEYVSLPTILSVCDNIENNGDVLLKLGKVALEGLLNKETNLVFQKRKLEKEIGVTELQFALNVGLISLNEARSFTTRNVSVCFFHESFQEFLAVIYIVTNKEVADLFCKFLSNVKIIMELSNVIMFICGMCPSLGSDISQRVVGVTDRDTEFCKYRKSHWTLNSTVAELYKLQLSWYRELPDRQTDSPVTFHVSDIYLTSNNDKDTVRVTRELLCDHNVEIRSLFFYDVPTDIERGITDRVVNDFLTNVHSKKSLVAVSRQCHSKRRKIHSIVGMSLRTVSLRNVVTALSESPFLKDIHSLRRLELIDVDLGRRSLGLSSDMIHIETVSLKSVRMSTTSWEKFVISLEGIHHAFDINLCQTDIDDHSRTKILSSQHFSLSRSDKDGLDIKRIWP